MSVGARVLGTAVIAAAGLLLPASPGPAQEDPCAATDKRQACSFQCCGRRSCPPSCEVDCVKACVDACASPALLKLPLKDDDPAKDVEVSSVTLKDRSLTVTLNVHTKADLPVWAQVEGPNLTTPVTLHDKVMKGNDKVELEISPPLPPLLATQHYLVLILAAKAVPRAFSTTI